MKKTLVLFMATMFGLGLFSSSYAANSQKVFTVTNCTERNNVLVVAYNGDDGVNYAAASSVWIDKGQTKTLTCNGKTNDCWVATRFKLYQGVYITDKGKGYIHEIKGALNKILIVNDESC